LLTQDNITPNTAMGANLFPGGGATFRVWAPRALNVYLNGTFDDGVRSGADPASLMTKDANGFWTCFLASAKDGDLYRFFVSGRGTAGPKRDPYARELALDRPFPDSSCVIRGASFPWHDDAFVTPDFSDMIVYQIHIGTYNVTTPRVASTFLDIVERLPYLQALGVNVLQPLPVTESETVISLGYDGADYFSPDFPYVVTDQTILRKHLTTINGLLGAKGLGPILLSDIVSAPAQLRALIDLCHLYGIAVVFDVVYNHAGDFFGDDDNIYFFDRMAPGNQNDSLYFTDQSRGAGGLSFALWNDGVQQFLINNALYCIQEFHIDGFRYDEISALLSMNLMSGWNFCRALTDTMRFMKPRLLQNAEFWAGEPTGLPKQQIDIVTSTGRGGAGFDVVQHDGLRGAVRSAVGAASGGQGAQISMTEVANNLFPAGLALAWQAVPCVENHDIVKVGNEQRLPTLADPSNHRSWYARSRSRVASALLLTAPGMPQLFMGQEVLEDKQWGPQPNTSNLIYWDGVNTGSDSSMVNHLRFTQDLIRLRWLNSAFRGGNVNAFHIHDQNRVLAFHRWLEDSGQDVIVVATFAESTWYDYAIGFPFAGRWNEIFNSDVYDNWVNPQVAGNHGGINASGPPMHGFGASANIVIPANGVVVFARG
jgi:1,4-alpha-glucan branching enzyme